jgi:hypothetical protein
LTCKVYRDVITIKLDKSIKFNSHFNNKHSFCEFDVDGFDIRNNTFYEFYGDYWHGNPAIKQADPVLAKSRYIKTLERNKIIELLGFKLITIWESDWEYEMANFDPAYLKDLKTFVEDSFIDPRNALHGGRTEVFKTFYETKTQEEKIFGFDISSQYPAVMALDTYAVGVKRSKN